VQHPEYFFGSSPEHAHIQPDNLEILVNHLKCAAFELPISPDERFGNVDLPGLCEQLGEAGLLHQSGGNWHWIEEAYPADTVSLRSVTSDNFVIIDTRGEENGKPEVIGEVDFSSALITVHPEAIYVHQGQQYHVEQLDFDKRKAYVKPVNVDYFTDAIRYTQVRVLEIAAEEAIAGPAARVHGDVLVRSQVVGFKKIKFFTNENVGSPRELISACPCDNGCPLCVGPTADRSERTKDVALGILARLCRDSQLPSDGAEEAEPA